MPSTGNMGIFSFEWIVVNGAYRQKQLSAYQSSRASRYRLSLAHENSVAKIASGAEGSVYVVII